MFHETARQQANAAVIEAQKPFAAKRLETYEKLATLTAAVHSRVCRIRLVEQNDKSWIKSSTASLR